MELYLFEKINSEDLVRFFPVNSDLISFTSLINLLKLVISLADILFLLKKLSSKLSEKRLLFVNLSFKDISSVTNGIIGLRKFKII